MGKTLNNETPAARLQTYRGLTIGLAALKEFLVARSLVPGKNSDKADA